MASTTSFHDHNSGMQTAINNGTINAQFSLNADPLDKLPIAHGAEFDSYMDRHEDECLLGTRTDLLNNITEWAMSPQGKCIFWLKGMAGTGKSTVSRTVAKHFKQENLLGASFFFRRGEADRGNAMKLFPTVSRQMAKNISQLIPGLQEAIYDEPDIGMKSLKQQFDNLLLRPIRKLEQSNHLIRTVVIVIDALDECEQDDDIRAILQLLPHLQHSNALGLRIFLTSRPELPIRLGFSEMKNDDYRDLALHQIPEAVTTHDISLFLNHRLGQIRKIQPLPIDWPGDRDLQALIALSVPLFIFAATVCRIFEDPQWDPVDSLAEILTHRSDGSKFKGTYLPVLNRLLKGQSKKQEKQLVEEFQTVIGAIVMLESPLPVTSLSRLIGLPERRVSLRLKSLHSVLSVPEDINLPLRTFHLSFRDFLLDLEMRDETPFWVDEEETQQKLTTRCLGICDDLRKNICGLPSDGTTCAEISPETIHNSISAELQYSCRYWVHHLVRSKDLHFMISKALLFLKEHFLHWVESMSILGYVSDVLGSISLLQRVSADTGDSPISEFLHDAKRFMQKSRQIAEVAPLQLYCSGLMFTPRKAIIRRYFKTYLPNWCSRLPQVQETWSPELQILEGHSSPVDSVAFSPNSQLLASGSSNWTIQFWDPATGALQQTLEGHSGPIDSVVFSPDGQLLASGSWDKTIRLWDPETGALQQTLECHPGPVNSVAFSPDGRMLASGSTDRTVRLWDPATGALQRTLKHDSGLVKSVAFSPDSRLIASGSSNWAIQLWHLNTGALEQTLEGHLAPVNSVVFSPDGQLLASGSWDKTVRLWDPTTGLRKWTLNGHSCLVDSVAFSPDGRLLASGSTDRTVRLWDPATDALQHTLEQTLEGHSKSVESVAFSPDGRLLASGSWDKTVKLWDPATGALEKTLNVNGYIDYLEFSEDGSYLITNLGDLHIQFCCEKRVSNSVHRNQDILIEQKQWIKLDGKKYIMASSWLSA